MAFCRNFSATLKTLGVSGLLYNSDLLLYNRESESLWSQVMVQAVSYPRKGERLITVPIDHTTWADWRNQYPKTEVLSKDTGFSSGYGRSSYGNCDEKGDIFPPCHFAAVCIILKKESLELSSMGSLKPILLWNYQS